MKIRLSEIFRRDVLLIDRATQQNISAQTTPVVWEQISPAEWEKIRYVCFHDDGMLRYPLCRLSREGSWLIILGSTAKTPDLNAVLDRCGKSLLFLRIDGRLTATLDVAPMTQLRYLRVEESTRPVGMDGAITGLEKLTGLETLHLEGTFDFDVLDVARMKWLRSLTVRDNQKLTDVTGLASLGRLEKLKLCNMNGLRKLDCTGLRKLRELELWNMKEFRTLTGLDQLSSLRKLRLCKVSNKKSVIDLSGMDRLEWVDLSDNKSLLKIYGLEDLDALKYFDISDTAITRIPDALRDKPLETLAMSKLKLEALADWLPELELPFSVKCRGRGIRLFETKVRDVNMDIFEQPREEIVRWFASLQTENSMVRASARDQIEESYTELLDAIILACENLQGCHKYWTWHENDRNTVIRNTLEACKYSVYDQTLQGNSSGKKTAGELDLKICSNDKKVVTICEALIVKGCENEWNKHLDKLLANYNPHGYLVLYLLTYVDCGQGKFGDIWGKFRERLSSYNPEGFQLIPESVRTDLFMKYNSTKVAMCRYRQGSYTPTVYHIFARMGDPDQK